MSLFREPATLPLIALAGLGMGWLLVQLYNRLPESWLQDYGFRPNDPEWPLARRIRSPIGTAAVMGLTAAGFVVASLGSGLTVRTLLVIVTFCFLLLSAVPDALNKIIPDQSVIGLALMGAAFTAADLYAGRSVRETAIDRIGGAVAAAGVLFLVGALATYLLKREAMGMGDIKLLFACGLLTGLRMVPLLYFVTFVSAALIAVPLLIRQRRRQDDSPEAGEPGVEDAGGEGLPVPDEDSADSRQTPLGPFIAAACFLCLVAGDAVSDLVFSGLL